MESSSQPKGGRNVLLTGSIAAGAFVAGPILAFLGIAPPLVGFYVFAFGGLLGIVTLLIALVALVRRGAGVAMAGLALGGVITLIFVMLAVPARQFPPINDITTDTSDPPRFIDAAALEENKGRDLAYPGEAFARQQAEGYPDLGPLRLDQPPAEVFDRVLRTAQGMPLWTITRSDADGLAVEGFATSRLFRFRDDFVIEVRPADGGSVVQMRSKSRDGRGDVGANAARIKAFFAEVQSD